jgi:hypothetical protein
LRLFIKANKKNRFEKRVYYLCIYQRWQISFIMRSILLNYSQPMYQGYAHSYHYDNDAKLNVVRNEKGMVIPFVDSKDDKLCISTKTEALRESDDTASEMLLISTKTRAEMESDDEGSFIYK